MPDFNPHDYLTDIKGRPYLEVKYRIQWLAAQYPHASIQTSFVGMTPDGKGAICHARIIIPDPEAPGGQRVGEGLAMHTPTQQAVDNIANASTSAIGRALAMVGIGTQFALQDFDETRQPNGDVQPVDAPVQLRQPRPVQATPVPRTQPASPAPAVRQLNPATAGEPATPGQLKFLYSLGMREFNNDRASFVTWRPREDSITKATASAVIEYLKGREDQGLTGTGGLPPFAAIAGGQPPDEAPPPTEPPLADDELPF